MFCPRWRSNERQIDKKCVTTSIGDYQRLQPSRQRKIQHREKIKLFVCKETLKHHLSIKYNFFVSLGQPSDEIAKTQRFVEGRGKYFRKIAFLRPIICLHAITFPNLPRHDKRLLPNDKPLINAETAIFPRTFSWRFIFRRVLRLSFHTCFSWRACPPAWLALLCVRCYIYDAENMKHNHDRIWRLTLFFSSILSACERPISLGLPLAAGGTEESRIILHDQNARAEKWKLFGKMIQERRMFRNDLRQRVVGIVL